MGLNDLWIGSSVVDQCGSFLVKLKASVEHWHHYIYAYNITEQILQIPYNAPSQFGPFRFEKGIVINLRSLLPDLRCVLLYMSLHDFCSGGSAVG